MEHLIKYIFNVNFLYILNQIVSLNKGYICFICTSRFNW